jgi:hypothetical protein
LLRHKLPFFIAASRVRIDLGSAQSMPFRAT